MKKQLDGIRIDGHAGTWHVIDSFGHRYFPYTTLFLLASDLFGEDSAYIIVDREGNLILDDIYNEDGYEEIEFYLTQQWYSNNHKKIGGN